ncbi:MAG TPA: ribosome biogenesis factor YjgA [Rhodocyclaceae bacterium]|jgi:ribosome-associated protein|nr:ribosome biogenesis factor YjgA [Rhodocyclaceae bacterium]
MKNSNPDHEQPDADELSDEGFYGRPSKSQKKREMDALQELGAKLVELSTDQLKKTDMPDELRAALREAQRIPARTEARRRQLQYIGRIMRKVDPTPLQAALDRIAGLSAAENARMHQRERLRDRFIADERVLDEITAKFPQVDIQQLRQLRRNALREHEQNKPPKSYREIYRVLRELENGPVEHFADDDNFNEGENA